MSEGNGELPNGWESCTLKEIVRSITYGHTASATEERVGPRFLRITDIQNGRVDWESVPFCECDDVEKYALKNGDIVIARTGATTGKNFLIGDLNEPSVFASYLIRLETLEDVSAEFISQFMRTQDYWRQITNVSKGSAQPGANASILSKLQLPVAPRPEQRRIVAKIEALQERSRNACKALAEVKPLLEQFRQSLLAAAFRGDLTADWREENPDVEPASELLERIRTERRAKWEAAELAKYEAKGKKPPKNWKEKYKEPEPVDDSELPNLPKGWCWTKIDLILSNDRPGIKTGPFGSLLKKHEHQETGVPVLGIENIGEMEFISGSKIHITDEKAESLAPYDVQPGDLLISRSGTVGEVCVAPDGIEEARFSTNIIRVVLHPDSMLSEIMGFLFDGSKIVKSQIRRQCAGSTRDFLNKTILESLIFPLPPLEEQKEILDLIHRTIAIMAGIRKNRSDSESTLTQLDQSILAKAFRGELVPQDPNDEPASVLLDRIRQQREANDPKKKPRKKKAKK